jgi:archaeal type IV pilus assembly protein PilA
MNYNKLYNKLKKNSKGLSPVVASIILIAVTVAVSVVVAAWMGGMTIGLMGNAEQATITNLDFSGAATGDIAVTIQNTGNSEVILTNAYINGKAVDFATTDKLTLGRSGSTTTESTQTYTFAYTAAGALTAGDYTAKFTTSKGNNVVLTATYVP